MLISLSRSHTKVIKVFLEVAPFTVILKVRTYICHFGLVCDVRLLCVLNSSRMPCLWMLGVASLVTEQLRQCTCWVSIKLYLLK